MSQVDRDEIPAFHITTGDRVLYCDRLDIAISIISSLHNDVRFVGSLTGSPHDYLLLDH